MTTIIIPDIHQAFSWVEPALEYLNTKYNYDEVIFLGDYFDNFGDIPLHAGHTASWLQKSIYDPKRVHLLGNHDMPYLAKGNSSQWCPGFTSSKSIVINNVLTPGDWSKFKAAHFSQDFLFSHAGFHPDIVSHPITGIPTAEQLVIDAQKALQRVIMGDYDKLFLPGSRMAEPTKGGITWCDWDDEFLPIDGINQIVGHTPSPETTLEPKHLMTNLSQNWCLDRCGRNYFIGILIDGKLTFTTKERINNEIQNSNLHRGTPESSDESRGQTSSAEES